jgi:hypothetical protein
MNIISKTNNSEKNADYKHIIQVPISIVFLTENQILHICMACSSFLKPKPGNPTNKKFAVTKKILHDPKNIWPTILIKNEFLPNQLYCVLVLLNLGDQGLLWRFYWKANFVRWSGCEFHWRWENDTFFGDFNEKLIFAKWVELFFSFTEFWRMMPSLKILL